MQVWTHLLLANLVCSAGGVCVCKCVCVREGGGLLVWTVWLWGGFVCVGAGVDFGAVCVRACVCSVGVFL